MRMILGMVALLLITVPLHAEPVYYKGTLEVKATSGKACTGEDWKKVREIELVLVQGPDGVSGYFSGDNIATGKFSGNDTVSLAVVYPFAEKELAEGHSLKLSGNGNTATGTLQERHLADTVGNCNYDLAELKLSRNDSSSVDAYLQKVKITYEAQHFRSQAKLLYRAERYGESIPLYEKALTLREKVEERGAAIVANYLEALASALSRNGDHDRAIALIEERLTEFAAGTQKELREAQSLFWNRKGSALHRDKKYDEAASCYRKAMDLQPEELAWIINGAVNFGTAGKYSEVETLLTEAGRRFVSEKDRKEIDEVWAELADGYFSRAIKAEEKQEYVEAVVLLEKALEIDRRIRPKDTAEGLLRMAHCKMMLGLFNEAKSHALESLALREKLYGAGSKEEAIAHVVLAKVYGTAGEFDNGINLLQTQRAKVSNEIAQGLSGTLAWLWNRKGNSLHKSGEYTEAVKCYRQALAVNPMDVTYLTNLARSLAKGGNPEEAEQALVTDQVRYTEVAERKEINEALEFVSDIYYTSAQDLERRDVPAAISLYKKALAIDRQLRPKDAAAILISLAICHKNIKDYQAAKAYVLEAISMIEAIYGASSKEAVNASKLLAMIYGLAGDYDSGISLLEKRIAGLLGEADSSLNEALADLYFVRATVLKKQRSFADAIPWYEKALAIDLKFRPKDAYRILRHLTDCHKELQHFQEAERYGREAISLGEKEYGYDSKELTPALNAAGLLYMETGSYVQAEPLFRRSFEIMERSNGPDEETATALCNLASSCSHLGHYDAAEAYMKRALAICESKLGEDHPETASTINNLAALYQETGRHGEAEFLFKRALMLREKAFGSEHNETAMSLNNLAVLYRETGRFAEAEALFKRSVAMMEKLYGPEHSIVAKGLNNLAGLYEETGRDPQALELYERVLAIDEKIFGYDSLQFAVLLNNVSTLLQNSGEYEKASEFQAHVISVFEKVYGRDHNNVAQALVNLGEMLRMQWRNAEAEPLYLRAIGIGEKSLGVNNPALAGWLSNLGLLYTQTGRFKEAEQLYLRALSLILRRRDPDTLWKIQSNYSQLLAKSGRSESAVFFGKQAVNTLQGLRQNVSTLGKETLKSFTGTVEENYKRLADLLIAQGRLAEAQQVMAMLKEEEYFQYLQRDAGVSLGTRASFTSGEEPWYREYEKLSAENARLGKELGELRAKDEKGLLDEAGRSRLDQLLAQEQKASEEFSAFVTRLVTTLHDEAKKQAEAERDRRTAELGKMDLGGSGAMMQTLQALGEGAVLIHYLIMDERVHILLTTPDIQLARHSVIAAAELNKKIFALRDQLKNNQSDPRPLATELYALLIAPLADDLAQAGARTLMLSLDGALRYLPFAALYDGEGYLVQRYRTVMYAEVAKANIALPAKPHWKVAALGVAGKVHDDFSALPSVPGELSGIVRKGEHGVLPGEIHLDREFTEQSLRQSAARNPVVHIASHFKFQPGTERDSYLLLGDGSTLGLDKVRSGAYFRNAELLTLSACETAMGGAGKGSEIEGFGAIAMERGAKAVIATLWPVADESTARLMRDFYRLREEGKLSKVEALRQAQLALLGETDKVAGDGSERGSGIRIRKEPEGGGAPAGKPAKSYAHPYFWAPFILMGNWK